MKRIFSFFIGARDEVLKIVWPTREQTIRYTVLVIIVAVGTGLALGALDYILTLLTASLIK